MCFEVLFQLKDTTIFATGGEDTTLRIHSLTEQNIRPLNVIRSHISNIRALCSISNMDDRCSDENTVWMVSAGGRAQFKIWKAVLLNSDLYEFTTQRSEVTCREVASHMLRTGSSKTWKSQEMTLDPETRYMSATAHWVSHTKAFIVLASSDGFLRMFEFDSEYETVRLLNSQPLNHCVLKVDMVHVHSRSILLSATTDGNISFWEIQHIVDWMYQSHESSLPSFEIKQLICVKAHQSGINSIAIYPKIKTKVEHVLYYLTIASGGDDNKIGICNISIRFEENQEMVMSAEERCTAVGHASQVTGLSWLSTDHLVSTSIDQRIIVWKLHQSCICMEEQMQTDNGLENEDIQSKPGLQNPLKRSDRRSCKHHASLEVQSSYFTGVPDVKGLSTNNFSVHKRIFIYGVGLQMYEVENTLL
ncbi:hypothetical protein SK128_027141 [Halocaridina rubra]|uniref:tRNA (34-2'-O)-methyltransferase regulator WDR6 n=1 Tax=Halocaridina rubra TaxID=373956 RepID=A0AAN8W8Z4_HALRR